MCLSLKPVENTTPTQDLFHLKLIFYQTVTNILKGTVLAYAVH